jgi:hypothetical protein
MLRIELQYNTSTSTDQVWLRFASVLQVEALTCGLLRQCSRCPFAGHSQHSRSKLSDSNNRNCFQLQQAKHTK